VATRTLTPPRVSCKGYPDRFSEPSARYVVHHLNQTAGFTVRRFIASLTPATGKAVSVPTTNPDSESGECRERKEDRCSARIAGERA
jgi:hypothetical protein